MTANLPFLDLSPSLTLTESTKRGAWESGNREKAGKSGSNLLG